MCSSDLTVYHLDVQQSLTYGLINSGIGLCGAFTALYLIEAIGRRPMFIISLTGGCVALLSFAFLPPLSAAGTLAVATAGFFFLSPTLLSLATYTAEIYPTHLRALGGGVASSWQRGASVWSGLRTTIKILRRLWMRRAGGLTTR